MATQGRRYLHKEQIGEVTVVHFDDKDIANEEVIQKIHDGFLVLAEQFGKRNILVNFSNVESFSTSLFGKLITLQNKLQAKGGKLVLCEMSKDIDELFEKTVLYKLFHIEKDQKAGLLAF